MDPIAIRSILPADNAAIASIIRGALTEFGVAGPGTAYHDSATDDMYASFQLPGSHYYIGLLDGRIAGAAGSERQLYSPTWIRDRHLSPAVRIDRSVQDAGAPEWVRTASTGPSTTP